MIRLKLGAQLASDRAHRWRSRGTVSIKKFLEVTVQSGRKNLMPFFVRRWSSGCLKLLDRPKVWRPSPGVWDSLAGRKPSCAPGHLITPEPRAPKVLFRLQTLKLKIPKEPLRTFFYSRHRSHTARGDFKTFQVDCFQKMAFRILKVYIVLFIVFRRRHFGDRATACK